MPQWKERGFHGGLRFAIKEWNPDLLEGLDILILSHNTLDNLRLQIGADYNEKVRLIKDDEIVYQKSLPHVITAGKNSKKKTNRSLFEDFFQGNGRNFGCR